MHLRISALGAVVALSVACGDNLTEPEPPWQIVQQELSGALMSIWGTSSTDVWAVGGDPGDGTGPMVIHFDGASWTRLETGHSGDLWWIFGFEGGPIYMGGAGGSILRYDGGAFTPMETPGTDIVFGIWGPSPDDLWAVGAAQGGGFGAFAWRLEGDVWVEAAGFPAELTATDAIWKVFGRGHDDAWLVGTNGKLVRWDGVQLTPETTGVGESLFTVHANSQRFAAVGGFGTGIILENDGSGWVNVSPPGSNPMVGVVLSETDGYAVGEFGAVNRRRADGWEREDTGFFLDVSLHAVWLDPSGGVWAVGGQVLTNPLVNGVLVHKGDPVPEGGLQ